MEMLCVPGIPNENNKNAHKREIRNKNFCNFFFLQFVFVSSSGNSWRHLDRYCDIYFDETKKKKNKK